MRSDFPLPRRFLCLLLSLLLLAGLAGCGSEKAPETTAYAQAETETAAPEAAVPETSVPETTVPETTVPETTVPETTGNVEISDGSDSGKDQFDTDPVPEGQQKPVEPGDIEIGSTAHTCYFTISCKTILDNMDQLEEGKEVLVPADGLILGTTAVTFYEGESVFDVLQRLTRDRGIHMSSRFTPMYNSAYIEGLHNLYEFDCGPLSGWMYCVNGWYPNYGVSRYVLQEGDMVELNYTCDLGRDLPGGDWMELQG